MWMGPGREPRPRKQQAPAVTGANDRRQSVRPTRPLHYNWDANVNIPSPWGTRTDSPVSLTAQIEADHEAWDAEGKPEYEEVA